MKKTILTTMLIITSLIVFGQARIGSSVADIKSEFSASRYNLKSDYDKDGNYYIIIKTERAVVLYTFNSNNLCNVSFIVPDDEGTLNFYAELYNKQYVIISTSEWNVYTKEGTGKIELVHPEDGKPFFVWQ